MPLESAPQAPDQGNEEFIVDTQIVDELVKTFLEPYRVISKNYASSPEKKRAALAEIDGLLLISVKSILEDSYKQKAQLDAMRELVELSLEIKYWPPILGNEVRYQKQEAEAKTMTDEIIGRQAERMKPPYFDALCKATVDETGRRIKKEIDQLG